MIRFIPQKLVIGLIGAAVALPMFGLIILSGLPPLNSFFTSVSIAVVILTAINSLGLWRILWKLSPTWFNRHIFPDLQGTYVGTVSSTWNNGIEIPDVRLVVKQTLLHMKVMQKTKESTSFSRIADLVRIDPDVQAFKLVYVYFNEPRDKVLERSLPHAGVADLNITIENDITLTGRYFNDPAIRATRGEMLFMRISQEANFS